MKEYKIGDRITFEICKPNPAALDLCEECFFESMCGNSSNLLSMFPCEYIDVGNVIFKEVSNGKE